MFDFVERDGGDPADYVCMYVQYNKMSVVLIMRLVRGVGSNALGVIREV